jgi:hypothetical protein
MTFFDRCCVVMVISAALCGFCSARIVIYNKQSHVKDDVSLFMSWYGYHDKFFSQRMEPGELISVPEAVDVFFISMDTGYTGKCPMHWVFKRNKLKENWTYYIRAPYYLRKQSSPNCLKLVGYRREIDPAHCDIATGSFSRTFDDLYKFWNGEQSVPEIVLNQ